MGGTLEIFVVDGVESDDVMGGSPPPKPPNNDGGPPPSPQDSPKQSMTAILFDGIALFARGPSCAFSTCLLAC